MAIKNGMTVTPQDPASLARAQLKEPRPAVRALAHVTELQFDTSVALRVDELARDIAHLEQESKRITTRAAQLKEQLDRLTAEHVSLAAEALQVEHHREQRLAQREHLALYLASLTQEA